MMLKTTSQRRTPALNGGRQSFMKKLVRVSSTVTLIKPQAGKSGLVFLTTSPLTLLCRISSYSKQGSLLLIYHVEPPYNKKQQPQEKKRRGGCSGRSAWSQWTCLMNPGLCLSLAGLTRSAPENCPLFLALGLIHHQKPAWWPGLWVAPTALPWLPFSPTRGGGTGLGWEGCRIYLSSWLSSFTEQLALLAKTNNLTNGCVRGSKMISKKNFGSYLPQIVSKAYLWTPSLQERTQEPKDVQHFPSGCSSFTIS